MVSIADLQGFKNKLKKTETKEFVGVNASDEISSEDWYAANIEKWYEEIKDFTFPTTFITMTKEEGKLLLKANTSCEERIFELTKEDKEQLKKLEEKLDAEIKKFPNGAFVKLSCRSPKDATAVAPEMIERYRNAVKQRVNDGQQVDANIKLIELFTSHIQLLCSHNAKEALKWFLSSIRVYQDIEMALKEDEFPVQVSIVFNSFFFSTKLVFFSLLFVNGLIFLLVMNLEDLFMIENLLLFLNILIIVIFLI